MQPIRMLVLKSVTSRLAACAFVAGALLFMERDAQAFCRTMTMRAPADYDPVSTGTCFVGGLPLFWRNSCIGYDVHNPPSRKVSYEDATEALSNAFTAWTGVTCPTEGSGQSRVSIDVRDLGPVDCDQVQYNPSGPNQNVVLFRDDTWPYPPEVLGLTTVVFAPDTGEIYGADMEINTKDMDPIAFSDPVPSNTYDFLSVVTHEAGHFLGIAHSDSMRATMYASYEKGETHQRILSPDDVDAVCTIYRPDGTRAVLNDKVTAAPGCDPTPRGGFTTQCMDSSKGGCSVSPEDGALSALSVAALGMAGALIASRRRRH